MATQIHTELIDDIDGSEATQTVRFALDGQELEVDLNDSNAERLRGILGEFTAVGRKAARPARTVKAPGPQAGLDLKAIRSWAVEQGLPVNPRGRIAQDVLDQYEAAH